MPGPAGRDQRHRPRRRAAPHDAAVGADARTRAPIEGEPHESYVSAYIDGDTEVGVWECTPGRFPGTKEGISEMMHFLSGRATITDEDGTRHELGPGTMFILLDGWRGEWEVHETVRKVYAIWPTR